MGSIFGGGSSETKVTQTRQIPHPTWYESQLLSDLFKVAHTDYYRPSSYLMSVLSKHYEPSTEFVREMQNPYLSLLPYQEKWGEILNRAATRGVINSTIMQNAMKELGQALAERGRELRWAGLANLEQARRLALADEYQRALAREEALRHSIEQRYKNLFNLWSTLYSGRMGVPTTIETKEGPGLFSQMAGSALGLGFGYWLGPGGGFSTIGSGLASLLGLGGKTAAEAATGEMAAKMAAQFGSPFTSALATTFI